MSTTATHIRFSCPGCSRSYRAPGRLQGRQITCANCETTISLGGGEASETPSTLGRRRASLLGWLAIALGVALWLNRLSNPFVDQPKPIEPLARIGPTQPSKPDEKGATALGVALLLWVLFLLTHHAHTVEPSLKLQAAQGLGR